MKARDFISVFEYMKTSAPKTKEEKRRRKSRVPKTDLASLLSRLSAGDLIALIAEKERENDAIAKFLKDKEKIHKKEDDKKGWSLQQVQTLLIFVAILAPFYAKWLFH